MVTLKMGARDQLGMPVTVATRDNAARLARRFLLNWEALTKKFKSYMLFFVSFPPRHKNTTHKNTKAKSANRVWTLIHHFLLPLLGAQGQYINNTCIFHLQLGLQGRGEIVWILLRPKERIIYIYIYIHIYASIIYVKYVSKATRAA